MIIPLVDELRLIAQNRNIRDYENKLEKNLIKALIEPKPKIKIDKQNCEGIRKSLIKLKHEFSKKEIDQDRRALYDIRNYRYLSASEINKPGKRLKLKKVFDLKSFMVMLIVLIMMVLIVMMMIMLMMNTEYLMEIITKPIRADGRFGGKKR